MRVNSTDLTLASSRTFQARHTRTESLRQWRDAPMQAAPASQPARTADSADISAEGQALAAEPDAKQKQVLEILERLFGITRVKSIDLRIDTSRVQASLQSVQEGVQRSGSGMAYDYHESYAEFEQSSLTAQGTITLEDGRSFKLDLSWQQTRAYVQEQSVSIRAGDAQLMDPLALDLTGQGLSFLDELVPMDLTGAAKPEMVHRLAGNAKWLVLDKNHDGKVTQDELFGARSGDGFGELAALDDDGNGWIDGGDQGFGALSLWDGVNAPTLLASFGIGALSTSAVSARFDHKDAGNDLQARTRQAGLYLRDDGSAGVTRQVDLVA